MKLELQALRREGDALLDGGEPAAALRAYVAILRRVPKDHGVRQAIGDALARGGYIDEATRVYEATAHLCIDGGLPFAACVAIFAIEKLERPARELRDELVRVYARGSERVGTVGARLNVVYPQEISVPARELRTERTVAELIEEAVEVATDLSKVGPLPPAFLAPALLGQLSAERLQAVLNHLWVHRLPVDHILLRRGDIGRSCYLVARGKLRVTAPDDTGSERELATLGPGSLVGEMALITGAPRLATVTVIEAADVLELGADALGAIGDELDQLAPVLDQVAQNRWLKNLLDQSPFFRAFDAQQRRQLLARCSAYEVPADTPLFTAGEIAKGVYLILRGSAQLEPLRDDELPPKILPLPSGAMLGVRSTLTGEPTAATARTTSPATILFLSTGSVARLRDAVPEFAAHLAEVARVRTEQLSR